MRHARRGRRGERGQGTLESVGIFVVASILVLASVAVMVQMSPVVAANVRYWLCKIIEVGTGGSGCEPPSLASSSRIPLAPCVNHSTRVSLQGEVAAAVKVKAGYTFFVDKMSDGTYRLTRGKSLGAGLGGGPAGVDASFVICWDCC